MKNIQLTAVLLFLLTFSISSCSKPFRNGTINRDCTGTYIELNDRDYLICNPLMTDSYQNGKTVKVKFKSKTSCSSNSVSFACQLYHPNSGIIEVMEIK